MSYIAFDLDALNAAPNVARAARVSEDVIIGGLLRLWAHTFRSKMDRLDALEVRGCFDTEADVIPALKAFGFLAASDDGKLRVKGADRYLRVSEARQKAGEARSRSAGRSAGRFTSKPPAQHQHTTSTSPAPDQHTTSTPPALTPNTEHRTPNTESKSTAPLFATPRDSDLLVQDFKAVTGSDYLWQGAKDGTALAALLKAATLDEVRTRWRRGLAAPATAWASCRTVAQLRSKWNDLGGESSSRGVAPVGVFLETRDVTL